jgi:hypothetical protein
MMTINLINHPAAKAIISGIGGALTVLELSLTPHTWPYIVVGVILAGLTSAGVYAQANAGTKAS